MTSPLELVERHYRNVSTANFDSEDELFSPDVETIDPGAGTLRGLQAYSGGGHLHWDAHRPVAWSARRDPAHPAPAQPRFLRPV
jgi:hypothetical protein